MLAAGAVLAVGAFAISGKEPSTAEAQGQELFLEWADGPENCDNVFTVPPNGATWHEIVPTFCLDRTQSGYEDNDDDGFATAGDVIELNGVRYTIASAGPVVYLDCANPIVIAPVQGYRTLIDPQVPWIEIYPTFGRPVGEIRELGEEANGELNVCDEVEIAGVTCHVKRIGCDIRVTEFSNANEGWSWGGLKGIFR
jgi:hypothetical protein